MFYYDSPNGLGDLTPDQLEQEMTRLVEVDGARLVALLAFVAEGDRRQVGHHDSMPDMATWLTHKYCLQPARARRYVTVARALGGLHRLRMALAEGRLGFDQVALLCEVADQESEEELLDFALGASWHQLLAEVRRRKEVTEQAKEVHRRRSLRWFESPDGTEIRFSGRGPSSELMKVINELNRRVDEMPAEYRKANPLDSVYFDALVSMAEDAASASSSRWAARSTVVVHIDFDVMFGQRPGAGLLEGLGVATARESQAMAGDGAVAYAWRIGRKDLLLTAPTYIVPARMRRLLWERDQGCRFCGRKFWLHVHHITPWPAGPTELGNLVLACRWHHR